ncbi:MAG: hypothetical protein OMOMHJEC_03023 [Xanthomonadales bacterium]|nr:hypothetical protein [Xanthomonadales bacterium]
MRGGAAIDLELALPRAARGDSVLELRCPQATSPQALGLGADVRELGFGLISAELR